MNARGEKATPRAQHGKFAIAAIDLDDTLVGRDGAISAANVAAVARLTAMGTRVLLASGRSHANMLPFHRQLGLPSGPIISAQGAIAQDSHSGEVWFEIAIPVAEVAEVTRDGLAHGFAVQFFDVPVVNDFFKGKVRRHLGWPGIVALTLANPDRLPVKWRTNLYVQAIKNGL